jgi:hypothetical protein
MEMNGIFEDEGKTNLTGKFTFKIKMIGLVLAALLPLGYTLAANINLGSNSSIEFGQGVLIATGCDDQILLKPGATFDNQRTKAFGVNSLVISDISNACIGKVFTFDFFSETSTSSSNSYGPIALTLIDSGTAGLHFELVGKYSTPAVIEDSVIDTATAGMGALGSTTFKGKSSVTLNRILSPRIASYSVSEAQKVTLQSSEISNTPTFFMSDNFINSCLNLSATNIEDLNTHVRESGFKVDQMLMLADYADEASAMFMSFSSPAKTQRAPQYKQLSVAGMRITSFIDSKFPLCEARLTTLVNAETDLAKIDALNEALQALNDAIDSERVASDAFAALSGFVNPYL